MRAPCEEFGSVGSGLAAVILASFVVVVPSN